MNLYLYIDGKSAIMSTIIVLRTLRPFIVYLAGVLSVCRLRYTNKLHGKTVSLYKQRRIKYVSFVLPYMGVLDLDIDS